MVSCWAVIIWFNGDSRRLSTHVGTPIYQSVGSVDGFGCTNAKKVGSQCQYENENE